MYLDSAIFVKLVVREPDSDFYASLVDGQNAIHTSELVVAECRSALYRKWRDGELDPRTRDQAWKRLCAGWEAGNGTVLHPLTRTVLEEAGAVIEACGSRAAVRTLDAIHLASCRLTRAFPLVTNDRIMRAAANRLGLPLGRLPS